MKVMLPPSMKNWLSLAGAVIALTTLFMIIFLFIVTSIITEQAAYLGLVTYILLPAVMVVGLLLIPAGMVIKIRKEREEGALPSPGWPRIDLEETHTRHAFFIFVTGTAFFLLISAVGSYEAFHFTESTRFCGTLCHTVMQPEYDAHAASPHAQVPCAACHVGPGADWYVRSKLSGLYQVYAVIAHVYPRPIPTPVKNLRPARAVCEQCHWPQKFYGHKLKMMTHYLTDKDNTPWRIGLGLKIGQPQEALGLKEGIHWHINPRVHIDYIPADMSRQQIPWVRSTNLDTGKTTVFVDSTLPAAQQSPPLSGMRRMDCIDCHNRPSHQYQAPVHFIDTALTAGRIPAALPEVKKLAVELCSREYESAEAAQKSIRSGMKDFYGKKYPGQPDALVDKGITGIQEAFAENVFPYMKARWSAYPDNIGHLHFKGCFRCHDGSHVSAAGEKISRDCILCHDITVQGTPGKNLESARFGESLPFRHPEDIGDAWKETPCTDCHTGLTP